MRAFARRLLPMGNKIMNPEALIIYCSSKDLQTRLMSDHSSLLYSLAQTFSFKLASPPDFTLLSQDHSSQLPKPPSPHHPLPPSSPSTFSFQPAAYFQSLRTKTFGQVLSYFPETTSTNSRATEPHFSYYGHGHILLADVQHTGRGCRGNVWDSPRGCLMFSVVCKIRRDQIGERLPFLQYVTALAIVEAMQEQQQEIMRRFEMDREVVGGTELIPLRIKWPNDILLERVKVGGILCEATQIQDEFSVSIGVGINLFNKEPTMCIDSFVANHPLLQDKVVTNREIVSRESFLASCVNSFENVFDTFSVQGFNPHLQQRYESRWIHSGQHVSFPLDIESNDRTTLINGIVKGISPTTGCIAITSQDGIERYLPPDVTSLDAALGRFKKKEG